RLVAAGGTPGGGSVSSPNASGPAATAQTEPLGRLPEPGATPAYPPAPDTDGPAEPPDDPPPWRQRAAVAALVAGVLLAALSLGGLAWALLNKGG
ncbi:serine/threonine protein kinase, partial [Streptomyces albiflaviniger]|nr:serine/threonine protein kinase [Streptomyces albiflaviniger]